MQLNIGGVVLMIASNPNDDNDDNGDNDDDETDTNWLDSYIRKYRNLIKNKTIQARTHMISHFITHPSQMIFTIMGLMIFITIVI